MDTKNFLESVLGAGEGYAVVTTDLEQKGKFFKYPAEIDQMVAYAEANFDKQVYFSPVLFKDEQRIKTSAKTVSVAYADSDLMDPKGYRIEPSITIQTAAGRTHNYWLLDNDYNPHTVALVNRRMHWAHRGEGLDRSFGHAAKMLRIPGSLNTNRGDKVVVVNTPMTIYSLADIEKAYPVDIIADKVYGTERPLPDVIPSRTALLNKLSDNKFIRNLLFDDPVPGKRSEMRYKLESELFRQGFEPEEVLSLVWDAPCCKYKQENRPMIQLWHEILNAEVDPENQPSVYDPDAPLSVDGDRLLVLQEEIEEANFLTDAERDGLYVTFIDNYEAWATAKTTSPAKYHRMAALMLMSVIYSEYGHVPFEFEDTGLNLWVMLLGNTTVDRKTTALKYMTGILASMETGDWAYDIGSDVTQQGLNKVLADKPNQSSLLHADEIQDVFEEVFSQGYLKGLVGYWTQLYSGMSRGTIRSTGDKQVVKAVPVHFEMYLTGIVTHVTEILNVKHFESGFLTRFLYVLVEPRPYDPHGDPLRQSPATTATYTDPVRDALISHLSLVRSYWDMRGTRDKTNPIRFNDQALARLNLFSAQVKTMITKSPRFETLKGPVERLVISVAKVAALFAMDEKKNTIEIEHVLAAIDLAEDWYDDLQKITAMVSESGWQRDLNKLESFIASKGGKTRYETAYKQFLDKRPQEFKEMADGLEDMGRIVQVRAGTQVTLEVVYASLSE